MTDMNDDQNDVLTALDNFLDELRREFRANPELAHRVVRALGAEVVFEGKDAAKLLNVRELAGTKDEAGFRQTLAGLSLAELKAVARANNLATAVDLKGMQSEGIVDLLYKRATAKVAERRFTGESG